MVTIQGVVDNGYTGTRDVGFSINQAANAITTVPVAATNQIYSGNPITLIATAGAATFGQVEYKLGANGTYSTTLPQATDANNYTIYYKVTATDNYAGCAEQSLTANIGQVDISNAVVTLSQTELNCTETDQTVDVTKVMVGNLQVGSNYYTVSGNTAKDLGDHVVTVTAKSDIANNFKGSATATFTIARRAATINIPAGQQYMTFISTNESLNLPNGKSAYIITEVSGNSVIIKQVSYIKKDVPVLIQDAAGQNIAETDDVGFLGNMLKYASSPVDVTGKQYILYNNEFVKATGTIPAGKNYLEVDDLAFARVLSIGLNDNASGIDSVVLDESEDVQWYDLQGRKINKPTKNGLYIMNGKKKVYNNK